MDQLQKCSAILRIMKKKELNPCMNVLLNVLILFLVGVPVLLFVTLASPQKRGFYCHDASLMYPLLPSTINNRTVIIGGLLIPIIIMIIAEIIKEQKASHDITGEDSPRNCLLPKMVAIATVIGYFLFGCGCIQTITDVTKYNIGRLRPHFHAACQTDWDSLASKCNNPLHPVYIYPIPCLNPDHHAVRDAHLSFFSGHASFSAFTMFYLIFYIENKVTLQKPALLKPFIQFLCLLITIYTSISRVFDYHHHWSDVLFGFILGGTMAYIIARYVSGLIKSSAIHKKKSVQVEIV